MLTETILRLRNLDLLLSCNLSTFAGLMGELVNRGSQSLTAVLLSVSVRQLNELDVLQLSDDQNDENEGIPHCGQIQHQLVFFVDKCLLQKFVLLWTIQLVFLWHYKTINRRPYVST